MRADDPQHLNALDASVERASCLSARHDWERKATAQAELFTMLGDVTGDRDLARMVSSKDRPDDWPARTR